MQTGKPIELHGQPVAGGKFPLICMSMGPYGSLTRLFGWTFGSALTFAVAASSSAPGQVPIEDLNTVLAILQKSMTSKQS